MSLKEFFELLADNPVFIIGFFLFIPFSALIAGWMGKGEGHLSPWKYFYATLIYLVCVPGIFSITLNIYLFLFEQHSIMETVIVTQLLPIISMIVTLLIIRKNVDLDMIPGFDKLSGLVMMIGGVLSLMWIADKTRILVFSFLPFQMVLLIFGGLLLAIRLGWRKLNSQNTNPDN